MNSKFNPYHAWLDLPAEVGRPNYYQLLRIKEFEPDVKKVTAAADRALARVRGFKPGDRAQDWSKLLDELAQARDCLVDPEKKQAYDTALKKRRAQSSAKANAHSQPEVAAVNQNANLYPPGMAPKKAEASPGAQPAKAGKNAAQPSSSSKPKAAAAGPANAKQAPSGARNAPSKSKAATAKDRSAQQPAPTADQKRSAAGAARQAAAAAKTTSKKPAEKTAKKAARDASKETGAAEESKPRSGLVNAHVAPPPEPQRSAIPLVLGIAAVLGLLTFGMLYLALHSAW